MTPYKNIIVFLVLIFMAVSYGKCQETVIVNLLSDEYYGMEKDTEGWWMQHPDNWSVSSFRAATGIYSLKYTNTQTATGELKAHGSGTIPEMEINMPVGTYTFSTKVFLESGSDITGYKFALKPGSNGGSFYNVNFDLTGIATDQWVEVTSTFEAPVELSDYSMLVIVAPDNNGKGTFYVDDISVPVAGEPEPDRVGRIASFTTNEAASVSLPAGGYKMSLKVFKESGSKMEYFYTKIENPVKTLRWDISSIDEDTWVTLEDQKFVLRESVSNSAFQILVPNVSGTTGFYIDDIRLEESEEDVIILSAADSRSVKIYPNPAKDQVTITSGRALIEIYNTSGVLLETFSAEQPTTVINLSGFSSGMYLVKIQSASIYKMEKLIVE